MLSKKLHDALNEQINAELWSAYLYLSMSMDAEAKGLKGVANWFFVQFQEEQDHARILMNYINSRDAKVELKPIAEVRTEWTSPLDMFKDTLEHEKVVTSMINNLASIAAEDKDFASANMLVWFVDEQVEEEERGRRGQQVRALYARQGVGRARIPAGFAAGREQRLTASHAVVLSKPLRETGAAIVLPCSLFPPCGPARAGTGGGCGTAGRF